MNLAFLVAPRRLFRCGLGFSLLLTLVLVNGCSGGSSPFSGSHPGSSFSATRAIALVTDFQTRQQRVGVAAAVVRADKLLWSGGSGFSNRETRMAADGDSIFITASISKTVVAVATMQLVEQKKLSLDADINTYLPFRVANPKVAGTITLRQLLTHTSGITDDYFNTLDQFQFYAKDQEPQLSLANLCKELFDPTGRFYSPDTFSASAPGSVFSYSNIGVTLAAYIVERASKTSFADYAKQHIFTPLRMRNTSYRLSDFRSGSGYVPNLADYYPTVGALAGQATGQYSIDLYPVTFLRTSVKDLSRYLRAFILDGTLEGTRILSVNSAKEIKRIQNPNLPDIDGLNQQGLIWFGSIAKGIAVFGHDGVQVGITTEMFYNPSTKSGAIVFTNGDLQTDEDQLQLRDLTGALIAEGEK